MFGFTSTAIMTHFILVSILPIPEAVFLVRLGTRLGASSFPARNELSMLFPYTSYPAGNELILKLTKNTASYLLQSVAPTNLVSYLNKFKLKSALSGNQEI
jgi:hypothetical protein